MSETDTAAVSADSLNDGSISAGSSTHSPLGDGTLPPSPLSTVIDPEAETNSLPLPPLPNSDTETNRLKPGVLAKRTQVDDVTDNEQYPQDGSLARANTVTSYGKSETVPECLDVPAIMSRLQRDLKKEEMKETRDEDEDEFNDEHSNEQENETKENGKKIGHICTEEEEEEAEKTAPIQVNPGDLSSEKPKTEPKLESKHPIANTLPAILDKGKGKGTSMIHSPDPVSEELRKPGPIPKFERGIGPAPGEGKYTSKKTQSKKKSGFRFFGFGSDSHAARDSSARNSLGSVQQKPYSITEKRQEAKMEAFLNDYLTKKAALSKARSQLTEATARVRALENSIQVVEKQMISGGIEIPGDE